MRFPAISLFLLLCSSISFAGPAVSAATPGEPGITEQGGSSDKRIYVGTCFTELYCKGSTIAENVDDGWCYDHQGHSLQDGDVCASF